MRPVLLLSLLLPLAPLPGLAAATDSPAPTREAATQPVTLFCPLKENIALSEPEGF